MTEGYPGLHSWKRGEGTAEGKEEIEEDISQSTEQPPLEETGVDVVSVERVAKTIIDDFDPTDIMWTG